MKNSKQYLKTTTLALCILGFSGCNQSATSVLDKEPIFGQNLQYTKVGKIIKNDDVEALVNITYLNSVSSKQWNNGKQNFLVGIYIANQDATTYSLTMNGKEEILKSEPPTENEIFTNIALKNNWAIYEIRTYEDVEEKQLQLVFKDTHDHNTTITFTKE